MRGPVERPLTPLLSLEDVHKDLLWHKDGRVSLVYRIDALHEPGLGDDDFDRHARLIEHVFSGVPEGTQWQFLVVVSHEDALEALAERFPRIPGRSSDARLFEEFREAKMRELRRAEPEASGLKLVQARRHYVVVSFAPVVGELSLWRKLTLTLRSFTRGGREAAEASWGNYGHVYRRILNEAAQMDQRALVGLLQMGMGARRCGDAELVRLLYELLNPSMSRAVTVETLSRRARLDQDGLPASFVAEMPWLADTSPVWSLLGDEMVERKDYLELGDLYVTVVSLRELPDRTSPGCLVPLLGLPRERYVLSFRLDVPRQSRVIAELKAKQALADGLRFQNFFVESDRKDPMADAVRRQADQILERLVSSTERLCGGALQVALLERSPEALDEAAEQVLGVMSRVHGLRAVRERYMLKRAFLSLLPGASMLVERRRKTPTPNAADMLPTYDFRSGEGRVAFSTPHNSVAFVDPWARRLPNPHVMISGMSGAGKSFLADRLMVDYEVGCRCRGEAPPYVFILDKGASYKRLMELRGDSGRYVTFGVDHPPGVPIFDHAEEDGSLDEHVSRLEWLLLDLLKVDPGNEERFERMKGYVELALYEMYREGSERNFKGFSSALKRVGGPEELLALLPTFAEGKFARLFLANPALELSKGVRAVCYDFEGLEGQRDLALVSLLVVIYQVRRWAARMARVRMRTSLLVDENWQTMDTGGTGAVGEQGALFLNMALRQGRKAGLSCVLLSQSITDWAGSRYGKAMIGNVATKFVGACEPTEIDAVREHLRLTPRQVEMLEGLANTDRYHEFLLVQAGRTDVVRVPGDPFSRWVFTTSLDDRIRLERHLEARPGLTLLEAVRELAAEG